MINNNKNIVKNIIRLLREIHDPEINISIYELGLIYDIQINKRFIVKIIMTLTTPNCPNANLFIKEIKQKIKTISHIKYIYILYTFNPIWNHDLLNEEINFKLGIE